MSSTSSTAPGASAGTGAGTGTSTTSRNLLQQLPSGTVLAFQVLVVTFTNQGHCLPSNWWLTVGLLVFLSSTCIFFCFTDSFAYKGKVYYCVVLPGRLGVLNMDKRDEIFVFKDIKPILTKLRLKTVDFVHAFLSVLVFLTIAGSDVGLQNCFFPNASPHAQQVLKNLPLGMTVVCSFLFMIFPTTRQGIRFDSRVVEVGDEAGAASAPSSASALTASATAPSPYKMEGDEMAGAASAPSSTSALAACATAPSPYKMEGDEEAGAASASATAPSRAGERKAADRVVMSSANPVQLLPSGPVLAFQTLAATFTNQGKCYHTNWWLSVGLLVFLSAICIFSSFTDCVQEPNTRKVHRAMALPNRLYIRGMSTKDQLDRFGPQLLRERCVKFVDWIHAFFSVVAFVTIAGNDVGMQKCFFPNADDNTQQLLKNLPLATAIMSSFVFMVFPTTRNSMSFDDSDNTADKKQDDSDNH